MLPHVLRRHPYIPLSYSHTISRRSFHTSRPRWAESDEDTLRRTIGRWIVRKVKNLGLGFIAIMVFGTIGSMLPTWKDTLDAITRVVGPKTIAYGALSDIPNAVYNPTHQDPAIRQLITRSDEFRVLVVEPGSGEEAVHCRLINVANSWRTRYDAFSYTWGDESLRDIIVVDGLRTGVTKNLQSALMHLRDRVHERMLWVDALCINQDDPKERGEQVAKMGFIYSKARRVVIWLGEQTEDVKGAFQTLEKWGKYYKPKDLKAEDFDWQPVCNLLRRPWFQRMWILQEAVLGRDPVLVCGFETLQWESLSKCHSNGSFQGIDDGPEIHQAMQAIDTIEHGRCEHHTTHVRIPGRGRRRSRQKYTPDFKLVSTLYEARGFQCKDVRDKVFGVLSLATNVSGEDRMLRPNYQASVEDIFAAVARWEIEKNRSLELLSYCTRKDSKHPDLPSWAPDFSDIDDSEAISFLQKRHARPSHKPLFSSLKKEPDLGLERYYQPIFREENGKTILILSGVVVDTITRVASVADDSRMMLHANSNYRDQDIATLNLAELKRRKAWIEEWVDIALATDPASPDKRPLPSSYGIRNPFSLIPQDSISFWESPRFGMSPSHWEDFSNALSIKFVRKGGFDIETYSRFLFTNKDREQDCANEASYRHLTKIMRNRRFCATATGRMGWVPRSAKEGDLVCLLSGAEVPIVLRRMPREETVHVYSVVGDAYFDRLMHGRKMRDKWANSRYYLGGERLRII